MAWQGLGAYDKAMHIRPPSYVAHSWSWASYNSVVASGSEPGWRDAAIVIDYHVELETSNPYGEVADGWMKLRTPLIPVSLSETPENDENAVPHRPAMKLKTASGDPFGGYPSFDRIRQHTEQASDYVKSLALSLLILAKLEARSDDSDDDILYGH